ncbi:MAG: hypothetical protein A2W36_05150 [Chloroflexi bacterium RBG_16_58_14]|nr:MAG: hypothetical protein A2W36_05150 [Chloroflexi bacterium RBG_16_58_14]
MILQYLGQINVRYYSVKFILYWQQNLTVLFRNNLILDAADQISNLIEIKIANYKQCAWLSKPKYPEHHLLGFLGIIQLIVHAVLHDEQMCVADGAVNEWI